MDEPFPLKFAPTPASQAELVVLTAMLPRYTALLWSLYLHLYIVLELEPFGYWHALLFNILCHHSSCPAQRQAQQISNTENTYE